MALVHNSREKEKAHIEGNFYLCGSFCISCRKFLNKTSDMQSSQSMAQTALRNHIQQFFSSTAKAYKGKTVKTTESQIMLSMKRPTGTMSSTQPYKRHTKSYTRCLTELSKWKPPKQVPILVPKNHLGEECFPDTQP